MSNTNGPFTLAISPAARCFAYVLANGSEHPYDWGVKRVDSAGKNFRIVKAIAELIRTYQPATIVIEETRGKTRRRERNRALLATIAKLAEKKGVEVVRYTRAEVRTSFAESGATTRPEIAKAIAAKTPEFAAALPRPRKIWVSEDRKQSIFDAAALLQTHWRLRQSARYGVLRAHDVVRPAYSAEQRVLLQSTIQSQIPS